MVLLIAGYPRSGTSMLLDLCNSHPKISLTREFGNFQMVDSSRAFHVLWVLYRLWQRGQRPLRPSEEPGLRALLANTAFATHYLAALLDSEEEAAGVATIERSLRKLSPGAPIVGDKYPDYVFSLDQYALRDEFSVVVIYRDCRDVAASVLEMVHGNWKNRWFAKRMDSAEKIARRWVLAIDLMQRYSDRIQILQYEELVRDPQKVLPRLGNWLDLDPSLFDCSFLHDKSIGRHKESLSDQQLETVLGIAQPTLERFGYLHSKD